MRQICDLSDRKASFSTGFHQQVLNLLNAMNAPPEQLLMGCGSAALCLWGLIKSNWFYEETKKGRWLSDRMGESRGLLVLRLLFVLGIAFGVALATNLIRPLFA